jgi:hypothetical protein
MPVPFFSRLSYVAAMRPLEKLPVWIVIRLCTDEDKMVDYWNNIDSVIELNMDVIDDPLGEAKEIHRSVRTTCFHLRFTLELDQHIIAERLRLSRDFSQS